jgi:hypothetical protein
MTDLLLDFYKKVREINRYFKLIKFLDDKRSIGNFRVTVEMQSALKANCYLMLYNLIEGSVFEGLDAIFADINSQSISFDQLKDNYKIMWLNYNCELVKRSKNYGDNKGSKVFGKKLQDILGNLREFSILPYTNKDGEKFENYDGYAQLLDSSEFSGNLDARKIREIAEKYGFIAPEEGVCSNELLAVKNFRNKLAHGEQTFSEVGQAKAVGELIKIYLCVFRYLRNTLKSIEQLIRNKNYLKK